MTSQVESLIDICQRYLDGKLSVDEYSSVFEETYISYQVDLPKTEFAIFDEIYMANDYFEPNDEIRKEDKRLINETELRRRIQKNISELTA
jgi:hypothetical protein